MDTNLNIRSTQTPRGHELLYHAQHVKKAKSGKSNEGCVFFIAHEKDFKFCAQPQTGAYTCLESIFGRTCFLFIN